jgi:hypothetical protein
VETRAIVLVLIGSFAGAYTFQKASIAALLCFMDRSASAREKAVATLPWSMAKSAGLCVRKRRSPVAYNVQAPQT